jgi:hypothetical protein
MAQILINEGAAPATPASGKVALYAKADGRLYAKDDAGTETGFAGNGTNSDITRTTALARIDGNVGYSTDASSIANHFFAGAITGGASAYALQNAGIIQSGVTTTAAYNVTTSGTAATVFSVANLVHNFALQGIFGAGSTVTTQTAFWAFSTLTGGTNNYGFRGSLAAATGRYNIFMDGTADNYIAGQLGVGVVPTARNNTILQLSAGIGFPATQVASTDANTLDDYEEGTFTPTFLLETPGTSSFTYSTQAGVYTKVGRLVTTSVVLATSAASAGTGTGNLQINGLPFTSSSAVTLFAGSVGYGANFTTVQPTATMQLAASVRARLYNGTTPITQAHIGASMNVYAAYNYTV